MTPINTLGIRVALIIIVLFVVGFGAWKLVVLGFSHQNIEQASPAPQRSSQPLPSPSPEQSLSPELLKQLSSFANTESKNIGPQTKKYVSSLPQNATQTQVLNQDSLNQYVASHKGDLLTPLPAGLLKLSSSAGKVVVKAYLDQISPAQNKKLQNITGNAIAVAFQKEQSGEDTKALTPILTSITANFDILKNVSAPKETEALQTKLLQATHALVVNIKTMQSFKQDPISGLIGLKNVSDLDAVYADISTQITALEKKYNLQ